MPKSVLRDVEAKVNALLLDDLPVTAEVMTQQQARDSGAMALFGEKYGDAVRVISVGDWARELCGGTHAQRSGQLGVVKLLGESSIGSGVRRVEALVGVDAYSFLAREHAIVGQLTEALQARPEELPERVAGILGRLKEAEREIAAARQEKALGAAAGLVSSARDFGGVALVTHDAGDLGGRRPAHPRPRRPEPAGRRPSGGRGDGLGGHRPAGRSSSRTTAGARAAGVTAGPLVRVAAQVLGGGGGGKDDLAQGGGTDPSKVSAALGAVEDAVRGAHRLTVRRRGSHAAPVVE